MRCDRRIFKSPKTALKVDRSTPVYKTAKLDFFPSLYISHVLWAYNVGNTNRNEKRNAVGVDVETRIA